MLKADRCSERSSSSCEILTDAPCRLVEVTCSSSSRSDTRSYERTSLLFNCVTWPYRSCIWPRKEAITWACASGSLPLLLSRRCRCLPFTLFESMVTLWSR